MYHYHSLLSDLKNYVTTRFRIFQKKGGGGFAVRFRPDTKSGGGMGVGVCRPLQARWFTLFMR